MGRKDEAGIWVKFFPPGFLKAADLEGHRMNLSGEVLLDGMGKDRDIPLGSDWDLQLTEERTTVLCRTQIQSGFAETLLHSTRGCAPVHRTNEPVVTTEG